MPEWLPVAWVRPIETLLKIAAGQLRLNLLFCGTRRRPCERHAIHVNDGAILERESTSIQGLTPYCRELVLLLVQFTHYSCRLEIP
jgi:hypothetical protein